MTESLKVVHQGEPYAAREDSLRCPMIFGEPFQKWFDFIWEVPEMGVPKNGWFIMEILLR